MKLELQLVLTVLLCNVFLYPQTENLTFETPSISAGAEYIRELQKAIREGYEDIYKFNHQSPSIPEEFFSTDAITTFDGPDFDTNPIYNSGFYFIPPDPIGAAGTDRVISVVNCMIECRTKSGTLLWIDDLAGFFTSLTPTTFTFDPKVIYDQYEGRFVVVDLEVVEDAAGTDPDNISRILLAVSKTGSPASGTGTDWWYTAIDAKEVISGADHWADYPGFAVDEEAVYVTANMFAHVTGTFGGTRLWIIDKGVVGGFYSGGAASYTGGWNFPSLTGGFTGTHQPAHVFGSTGVAPGVGTFLVKYDAITTGGVGGLEAVQVIRVDDPLGSPTFSDEIVFLGDIENVGGGYGFPALPDAPQSGSATTIEVNDRRTLHAVWRSDSLYVTTTINPNTGSDAGQTTAHWIQLNTSTLGSTTLTDQGDVGGEDIASTTYTFFPAIAVNSTGDVIIGFSASASTIYPGAYYAGRFSSDPAGTVNSSVVVKAGLDYYVRKFSGTRNRWGDYTGASIDPSDDSFWLFNQYAMTRGTTIPPSSEDGRWATVYANVPLDELPVELSSFTAKVLKSGGIKLDWRTETEVSNYGFEVERLQDFKIEKLQDWEKIGFVEGNGNSNSPKDYSFTDNSAGYGKYAYRLKQIDTDGQFEYSKVIEVDAGNIPNGFVLEQNYPNPFNPSTTINFALAETQQAKLIIYDMLGNEVAIPFNGTAERGKLYEVEFSGETLSSGIYFYRFETDNKVENRKMLLVK